MLSDLSQLLSCDIFLAWLIAVMYDSKNQDEDVHKEKEVEEVIN